MCFSYRIDTERLAKIGPEHGCAEWIVRCGGAIRWQHSSRLIKDFNALPSANLDSTLNLQKQYVLEEIYADGATIADTGFHHIGNLNQAVS